MMMTEISKRKMHPIHVILVHFPSALYPFALIMEVLGYYCQDLSYSNSAFYALAAAFGFSCLAIVFGVIDFYKLDQNHAGWKTASYHAILNVVWFFGFTILLKLRYNLFIENSSPALGFLIFFGILNFGMIISNHLGGDLVFKYKIGIQDTPSNP